MDNKFYVSFETARLLKEKGYRQTYHAYYFGDSNLRKGGYRGDSWYDSPDFYPAPTKAEAIDWLDSKGIVIIVDEYYIMCEEDDYYTSCWGYYIRKDDKGVCRDNSSEYKTRLEAEEAAIIKAWELL